MNAAALNKQNLLRLYRDRLEATLNSDDLHGPLQTSISEDRLAEIVTAFQYNDSDGVRKLVDCLIKTTLTVNAYDTLVNILATRDIELHKRLYLTALKEGTDERRLFLRLVHRFGKFVVDYPAIDTASLLSRLFEHNEQSYASLIEQSVQTKPDVESQLCVCVRELPYVEKETAGYCAWYWDFLHCLKEQNADVTELFQPNFDRDYEFFLTKCRLPKSEYYLFLCDQPVNLSTMELARHRLNPHLPLFDYGGLSISEDDAPPDVVPIALRSYQKELVKDAMLGLNTIICAPTGSGKTIVATAVIKQHLIDAGRQRSLGRVVFVVPSIPLVSQQREAIALYLRPRWRVSEVFGISGGGVIGPRAPILKKSDVTVLTAQVLLNLINSSDAAERISLSELSLLVFDECHHTDKGHPYNELMLKYLEQHHHMAMDRNAMKEAAGDADCNRRMPQVIGLTASLGVGKETKGVDQVAHIIKMAANISADRILDVKEHVADLALHMNSSRKESHMCANTRLNSDFYKAVNGNMAKIEGELRPMLCELETLWPEQRPREKMPDFSEIPSCRWGQCYCSWFSTLLKTGVPVLHMESDRKSFITACLEHLKMYYKALEFDAHLWTQNAVNYMTEWVNERKLTHIVNVDKARIKLFEGPESPNWQQMRADRSNPLVAKLIDLLRREYEQSPNMRAIVFVRTRELTVSLEELLNSAEAGLTELNDGNGFRTGKLTSVNQSSELGGQAASEQAGELSRFRNGDIKVLVATTVAEEGLDVLACKLVVEYNLSTNEIALVQRKGRGRAEGSRSVLLAIDPCVVKRDQVNQEKEQLMRQALAIITKYGLAQFRDKVTAAKKDILLNYQQQQLTQHAIKTAPPRRFSLQCRACDNFICDSSKMKRVVGQHYFCTDPNIWERTYCLPVTIPDNVKEFKEIPVGALRCKGPARSCERVIGQVMKHRGVFLPAVKCDSVTFTEQQTVNLEKHKKKKWKDVLSSLFHPGELRKVDLTDMHKSLDPDIRAEIQRRNGICEVVTLDEIEPDEQLQPTAKHGRFVAE